jgi:hypothetical protein
MGHGAHVVKIPYAMLMIVERNFLFYNPGEQDRKRLMATEIVIFTHPDITGIEPIVVCGPCLESFVIIGMT